MLSARHLRPSQICCEKTVAVDIAKNILTRKEGSINVDDHCLLEATAYCSGVVMVIDQSWPIAKKRPTRRAEIIVAGACQWTRLLFYSDVCKLCEYLWGPINLIR